MTSNKNGDKTPLDESLQQYGTFNGSVRPGAHYDGNDDSIDIKIEGLSNETFCSKLQFKLFPSGYKKEFIETIKLSWPMVLTSLTSYLFGPVSLMFCGHLGTIQLDGVSLANSVINVTGISVGAGLATACDTLFSQTYGSVNKKRVGMYLQQSLIILTLCCFPCWAIHVNIEKILIVIGQNPQVAIVAGEYMLYFIPGVFASFMFQCVSRYLQTQSIVYPTLIIGIVANALNAGLHMLLVKQADMGTNGSAVCQVISYTAMLLMTVAYILGSKVYEETWDGWSRECFEDWGLFFKLGIPGMLMVCIEWWSFEIGTLLTGMIGVDELGAQSIMFQLESFAYMLPMGVSIACSIRVGQLLGAADSQGAQTAASVAYTMVWMAAVVTASVLLAGKNVFPVAFTSDQRVIDYASTIIPLLAIFTFLDATAGVSNGILRGTGKQSIGAVLIFIGYYIVGLPVGIPLMFLTSLKVEGFWWGLVCGLGIEALFVFIAVTRIDWEKEVEKAQLRAGTLDDVEEDCGQLQGEREEDLFSDEETGLLSSSEPESAFSDTEVDRRRKSTPGMQRSASHIVRNPDKRKKKRRRRPSLLTRFSSPFPIPDNIVASRPKSTLSKKQIIFRRSLAVLISLSILGVGLLIRFLVK